MTNSVSTEKENVRSAQYSGWAARIFISVALIVALLVRTVGYLDDPPSPFDDPAIRNLVVLISCFLAGFAAWIWFCFRSPYPRVLRLFVAAVPLLVITALLVIRFVFDSPRIFQFSGSLVPRLAPREHDFASNPSDSTSGQADFSVTSPEDFPQFLGPNRNGWIPGPLLSRDWKAKPPRLLWKRPVGAGWSAFTAINGFAVTLEQRGNKECAVCYEIESGRPVWEHSIEARHETALGGIGPRSTPTIHEGRIYVLGATGILQCLDDGGRLLWSDDLRKRYGITDTDDEQNVTFGRAASPLIVDSMVIVPGGGPPGKAKNLVAFDRETGRLAWEAENKLPNGEADQIAYASPSLATLAGRRQIVIVNESTVSGHDPATGERLWTHPWPGSSSGNASTSQAVAIGGNRLLLSKGYAGGAELIELQPAAGHELATSTVWRIARVLQTKFSNVVIHDGHAFALSEGILECVKLENGERRWKKGRFGHGQVLGVGDLLLVLSEEGELNLVELNAENFVQLSTFQVLEGKTWNNLCLFGNRLLVRNGLEAACYELP